jgi:putative zinc finger protein
MPSEPRVPTEPSLEDLSSFIDNELDPAAQARVAEHVAGCRDCQARLDGLRQTAHAVRGLPMETPPRSFTIPAQRRQAWRWAPVGWIGSAVVALLLVAVGIQNLHLPAGSSASTSTISGGLAQGPVTLSHQAAAPVAPPAASSNDQQFYGQASRASANVATVVDPSNSSRRLVLDTDSTSYVTNGRMQVTVQLIDSPSTSLNAGDQGLTLTLVRNGVGVALKPVGVESWNGTPIFGGSYDLAGLPLSSPRAGAYRLEATWAIPDGSGRVLQASVPVTITS